jgi:hypothetical protein
MLAGDRPGIVTDFVATCPGRVWDPASQVSNQLSDGSLAALGRSATAATTARFVVNPPPSTPSRSVPSSLLRSSPPSMWCVPVTKSGRWENDQGNDRHTPPPPSYRASSSYSESSDARQSLCCRQATPIPGSPRRHGHWRRLRRSIYAASLLGHGLLGRRRPLRSRWWRCKGPLDRNDPVAVICHYWTLLGILQILETGIKRLDATLAASEREPAPTLSQHLSGQAHRGPAAYGTPAWVHQNSLETKEVRPFRRHNHHSTRLDVAHVFRYTRGPFAVVAVETQGRLSAR